MNESMEVYEFDAYALLSDVERLGRHDLPHCSLMTRSPAQATRSTRGLCRAQAHMLSQRHPTGRALSVCSTASSWASDPLPLAEAIRTPEYADTQHGWCGLGSDQWLLAAKSRGTMP